MSPAKQCLVLALMFLPAGLSAQSQSADTTAGSPATRVMARLRGEGVSGEALFVLRGFRGNWTRSEQDELADSLAAFVIGWSEGDEWKKLEAAFGALSLSSRAEGYGSPYAGAGQRLQRIAQSGVSHSMGSAMNAIAQLADSTEAIHIVERLARFPGPAAEIAVQRLESAFGDRGLDALRRLHVEGTAGTPEARQAVAGVALRREWAKPK